VLDKPIKIDQQVAAKNDMVGCATCNEGLVQDVKLLKIHSLTDVVPELKACANGFEIELAEVEIGAAKGIIAIAGAMRFFDIDTTDIDSVYLRITNNDSTINQAHDENVEFLSGKTKYAQNA